MDDHKADSGRPGTHRRPAAARPYRVLLAAALAAVLAAGVLAGVWWSRWDRPAAGPTEPPAGAEPGGPAGPADGGDSGGGAAPGPGAPETGTGAAPAPAPGSGGAPAQEPGAGEAPDLMAVAGPRDLSLDQLAAGLAAYLNAASEPPAGRLEALYARWGLRPAGGDALGALPTAAADLDGNGEPELVTALTGSDPASGMPEGTVFVIYRREGRWLVDRGPGQPGLDGAGLHALADLARDGRPEIVWFVLDHGAHTAVATVLVAAWAPGQVTVLPGYMSMASPGLSVDGRDVLLSGGLIGSAGAGMAQRPRSDRYRWIDGAFRLADRRYAPSEYGYHWLIDGIAAEQFGRPADAEPAYAGAMAADRTALPADWVPPEQADAFAAAVRVFARFRLGLLYLQQDRGDAARAVLDQASGPFAGLAAALARAGNTREGCRAAALWAQEHPEFLAALNSPYGYGHPNWEAPDVCGLLPSNSGG